MSTLVSKLVRVIVPCGLFAAGGGYWWNVRQTSDDAPSYRTATIEHKDITVAITASGTIEPEEIVDVGAQVAGKITAFGQEPGTEKVIDYGSPVEPGTVLALIDDDLYREEVELAKADLTQAKSQLTQAHTGVHQATANLSRAEGDLRLQQAKLSQYERDNKRTADLYARKAVSDQEAEAAASLVEQTKAAVEIAQATIEQSQAAVEAAQASLTEKQAAISRAEAVLRKAETNLGYTTIKSPIRGVVVDRRVNIGQTVVSNLNAPSLFLIAKDLRRIEVWASVNEADIGSIRIGMPVQFTVDAYRNEVFTGAVKQIRLNATMTQSVVTYTVVASVDNSTGKLLPYLTANLRFIVNERKQALSVPSAAMRWQPSGVPDAAASNKPGVWVADSAGPRRVEFTPGITDGSDLEVLAGDLREGMDVIVGEAVVRKSPLNNPFAPSLTQGVER